VSRRNSPDQRHNPRVPTHNPTREVRHQAKNNVSTPRPERSPSGRGNHHTAKGKAGRKGGKPQRGRGSLNKGRRRGFSSLSTDNKSYPQEAQPSVWGCWVIFGDTSGRKASAKGHPLHRGRLKLPMDAVHVKFPNPAQTSTSLSGPIGGNGYEGDHSPRGPKGVRTERKKSFVKRGTRELGVGKTQPPIPTISRKGANG